MTPETTQTQTPAQALADLLADLEAIGFSDPDADVNGGDLTELIGNRLPHLRAAALPRRKPFRLAGIEGKHPVTLAPDEVTAATTALDVTIACLRQLTFGPTGDALRSCIPGLQQIRDVLAERTGGDAQ